MHWALPWAGANVPAGHAGHAPKKLPLLNVAGGQMLSQRASNAEVHWEDMKRPGGQRAVQARHWRKVPLFHVPGGQGVHVRSAVGWQAESWPLDAGHAVLQARQWEAELHVLYVPTGHCGHEVC